MYSKQRINFALPRKTVSDCENLRLCVLVSLFELRREKCDGEGCSSIFVMIWLIGTKNVQINLLIISHNVSL